MDEKQLLAEIDSVLAKMPPTGAFDGSPAADIWLGVANAVLASGITPIERSKLDLFNQAIEQGTYAGTDRAGAIRGVTRMLNTMRHTLLMATGGTGTVAIDHGMHFEYFDGIRKIVQTATADLLIVDQFLNEDVLSKFCVFAREGVAIRLLGRRYMSTLLPAAVALNQQRGKVQLRASDILHDRYVIVDREKCFLSGASLKDGPQNAISLISEIVDGAASLIALYEAAWESAQVRL